MGIAKDAFEIGAFITGFGTEKFAMSNRSREVTQFITVRGLGFINNAFFTFLTNVS